MAYHVVSIKSKLSRLSGQSCLGISVNRLWYHDTGPGTLNLTESAPLVFLLRRFALPMSTPRKEKKLWRISAVNMEATQRFFSSVTWLIRINLKVRVRKSMHLSAFVVNFTSLCLKGLFSDLYLCRMFRGNCQNLQLCRYPVQQCWNYAWGKVGTNGWRELGEWQKYSFRIILLFFVVHLLSHLPEQCTLLQKGVIRGVWLGLKYMGADRGGSGGLIVNVASYAGNLTHERTRIKVWAHSWKLFRGEVWVLEVFFFFLRNISHGVRPSVHCNETRSRRLDKSLGGECRHAVVSLNSTHSSSSQDFHVGLALSITYEKNGPEYAAHGVKIAALCPAVADTAMVEVQPDQVINIQLAQRVYDALGVLP